MVRQRFLATGTSVLWINEAYDLFLSKSTRNVEDMLKTIKSLMQGEAAVIVILSGTERLGEITSIDQQVNRPFTKFMPRDLVIGGGNAELDALIRDYSRRAGLDFNSEGNVISRLIRASRGRFGRAVETSINAIEQALLEGDRTLDRQHFAEARGMQEGCAWDRNLFVAENWQNTELDVQAEQFGVARTQQQWTKASLDDFLAGLLAQATTIDETDRRLLPLVDTANPAQGPVGDVIKLARSGKLRLWHIRDRTDFGALLLDPADLHEVLNAPPPSAFAKLRIAGRRLGVPKEIVKKLLRTADKDGRPVMRRVMTAAGRNCRRLNVFMNDLELFDRTCIAAKRAFASDVANLEKIQSAAGAAGDPTGSMPGGTPGPFLPKNGSLKHQITIFASSRPSGRLFAVRKQTFDGRHRPCKMVMVSAAFEYDH